jgi:hypothetical protein
LQFWHFKLCENLSLMNTVTDIHSYPADITGNLGMKVDLLIWLKLAGYGERACEIAARDRDNGRGSGLLYRSFAMMIQGEDNDSCQAEAEKHCDP